MEGNGHNPGVKAVTPEVRRLKASGPILLLAILFVAGAFLSWYFTWFGRDLSDADIAQYLVDEQHPRHVQHALLQIQKRIEQGDQNAKQWYPKIINFADHRETEFRLTVAWIMGFDNRSPEFHEALLKLVKDNEPIVRRNAALALVRFNDSSGADELAAVLTTYDVKSPAAGAVSSVLKERADASRGTLLARITQPDGKTIEVRSPLSGKIQHVFAVMGDSVAVGAPLLSMNSDEASVWEALRGLTLVGRVQDLPGIESFAQSGSQSDRIRKQAALTANAIKSRQ